MMLDITEDSMGSNIHFMSFLCMAGLDQRHCKLPKYMQLIQKGKGGGL